MSNNFINDVIDSTTALSSSTSGSKITNYSGKAANTVIMAQVIRVPSAGAYAVELQAGIVSPDGDITYGKIGEFDDSLDAEPSTFFISLGCKLRFEHITGVQVKVRLTG